MKIKQLLELVDRRRKKKKAVVSLPAYPAMARVDAIKVLGSPVLAAVLLGYDVQYLRKTDRQTGGQTHRHTCFNLAKHILD